MDIGQYFNNLYNFKNPIRHFWNLNAITFPADIDLFEINELCWTLPVKFRIRKFGDKYRTLKFPNVLSYRKALVYYKNLENFDTIGNMDNRHKRLMPNIKTGEFNAGEFERQLIDDFQKLCTYDYLIKLDIKEYYGKIYTHYLGFEGTGLQDYVLSGLNNGRTAGLMMGNYLSLYFAEKMLSDISKKLETNLADKQIECEFNYFSDDFYFFCNKNDVDVIINEFSLALEQFDLEMSDKKIEILDYEKYNQYNMLTRYWKSIIRHWNESLFKHSNIENSDDEDDNSKPKRLVFLNQLIYRISAINDEKNKVSFVNHFFKTEKFKEENFEDYSIAEYDYHQLCFLMKLSPEMLLYTVNKINNTRNFSVEKLKKFLCVRYEESLKDVLHDEQIYYFYAIKKLFSDMDLRPTANSVLKTDNQVLISYYLKYDLFSDEQVELLKGKKEEQFWLQNYHLILFKLSYDDLEENIKKYLIPKQANNLNKIKRFMDFYKSNLSNQVSFITDIENVEENVNIYLETRIEMLNEQYSAEDADDDLL